MLNWQKNLINGIIMTFTWSGYSLQTRYQIYGQDLVSQVRHAPLPSNFARYVGGNKRISSVTSSYLSGDSGAICRPGTEWGPELISQVLHTPLPSNFFRYIGITTEFHQWYRHGGHLTLAQFTDHLQNEDHIISVLHTPLPSKFVR